MYFVVCVPDADEQQQQVDEDVVEAQKVQLQTPPAVSDPTDHTMQTISGGRKVLATPAVRRIAMEHRVSVT